jgi:hypothetical protein
VDNNKNNNNQQQQQQQQSSTTAAPLPPQPQSTARPNINLNDICKQSSTYFNGNGGCALK